MPLSRSNPDGGAVARERTGGRYQSLQVLRFNAAFAVVLFHVHGMILSPSVPATGPIRLLEAGVDVFFVISGFIMAHTTRSDRRGSVFMVKRLSRVVPLYWLMTLPVILLGLFLPGLMISTEVTWDTVLKSLFFVPYEKSTGLVQPLLFVGWTLNYEMFFYVIFGACLAFGRAAHAAAILVILGLVLAGHLYPAEAVIWRFYTDPILLEFAFGIALYHLWIRAPRLALGGPWPWLVGLFAVGALMLFDGTTHRAMAQGLPAALLVYASLCLAVGPGRVGALLVLLGDASYAIYLVHPYFLRAGADLPLTWGAGGLVLVALLSVVATLLTSILLFRAFERPVQRGIQRWTGGGVLMPVGVSGPRAGASGGSAEAEADRDVRVDAR